MTNSSIAIALLTGFFALAAGPRQSFADPQAPSDMPTAATDRPADDSPIVAPVKRVAPQLPENKAKIKAAAGMAEKSAPPAKSKPNQKAAGK